MHNHLLTKPGVGSCRLSASILAVSVAVNLAFAEIVIAPASPRAAFNFNSCWRLFIGDPTNAALPEFDDAAWQAVTLPHAWNEDAAFKVASTHHPAGIAWYRKHFKLPAEATGKKVFVEFEVVDAQGHRCPTAMNAIQFTLDGPADWRGGIAQGRPDNHISSKVLPVECGINRVLLRSQPQAGKIVLAAGAEGLKPAHLELASTPFPTADGLSKTLPDAGLVSRFGRGPTPAGDSIKPTRKAVRVVSATAGSNLDKAGLAFDDNEATGWKNDSKRATGWIQFELERSASVNEVVLKLGGWRRKSYPLRVTVDGREAYSGMTPKNLGYVTLPLKPTPGKTVRIELVGAIDDKDGFGMVEVAGKKLPDTADIVSTPGALEIVEAEIYEPLTVSRR